MTGSELQVSETPNGMRFGLIGTDNARPAPLLFNFSAALEDSLESPDYSKVVHSLASRGVVGVSLDIPCHGRQRKPRDPDNGLAAWRNRIEGGENVMSSFVSRARHVLDFLIDEGVADPQGIASCGTSRGGFAALHLAAADRRVRYVAAFAPVTDLLTLIEFRGMEQHALTQSLALINVAEELADCWLWLCIGNNDQRVGTDHAIGLAHRVTRAAVAQGQPAHVELHVMETEGHRIHATAHDEAALWLAARFEI